MRKEGEMKRAIIFAITALILFAGCSSGKPGGQVSVTYFPEPAAMQTPDGTQQSPQNLEPGSRDIVNPDSTYSYEQMISDAEKLKETYPDLIDTEVIGKSVEGRDILLMRIGKGDKKVVFAGAHHAREYITSTFLMETIDEYARAYSADEKYGSFDLKALLDESTLYIVPMVNPDGVNLVQNGIDAVQDKQKVMGMRLMQDGYESWKANINGVDLNRQYPCHWDEKESNTDVPSSEMYKGTAPATEPEVQTMMKLCKENEFQLAASFHTKGEVIYWADSGTNDAIPAARPIAQTLADVTGYDLQPVSENPAVYAAGFENWFRQDFLRPAFCIELTPAGGTAPHDDSEFSSLVWDKAKYLCADLLVQALELE